MYPNLNHNWYPEANFKNEWILHSSETEKGKPKGKVLPNQQVWLENCLQMWPFDKNTHKHQLPYNCHSKCGVPSGNKSLPLWWSCTPVFNWLCECVTAERHTRWNCTYWDLELGRYTQPRLFLGGGGERLRTRRHTKWYFCVLCVLSCVSVLHLLRSGRLVYLLYLLFVWLVSGQCVSMSGLWCLIGLLGNQVALMPPSLVCVT